MIITLCIVVGHPYMVQFDIVELHKLYNQLLQIDSTYFLSLISSGFILTIRKVKCRPFTKKIGWRGVGTKTK